MRSLLGGGSEVGLRWGEEFASLDGSSVIESHLAHACAYFSKRNNAHKGTTMLSEILMGVGSFELSCYQFDDYENGKVRGDHFGINRGKGPRWILPQQQF